MKFSYEKPPVWDDAFKVFGFDPSNTVFTYGDVLYNPGRIEIPDHLLVHEETHAQQQQYNDTVAKIWWQRYIADPVFRVDQEVEAYGAQYNFICHKVKDKNARFRNLHMMAQWLSGEMYGSAVSYTDALRRIRLQAGLK